MKSYQVGGSYSFYRKSGHGPLGALIVMCPTLYMLGIAIVVGVLISDWIQHVSCCFSPPRTFTCCTMLTPSTK